MAVSNRFRYRRPWGGAWRVFARSGDEKGSTLIEFAMVALVLFTLLIGIIYGGTMAYDRVVLTNAVANGVRTLATESGDASACSDAQSTINGPNGYPSGSPNSTAYGLNLSKIAVVPQSSITFVSISITNSGPELAVDGNASCSKLTGGDYAVMWASYPCSMYFPRLGINLCPLSQSSTNITYSPCQTGSGVTCSSPITITVTCPSTPCIYAIESARISGSSQTSELSTTFGLLYYPGLLALH